MAVVFRSGVGRASRPPQTADAPDLLVTRSPAFAQPASALPVRSPLCSSGCGSKNQRSAPHAESA